MPINEYDLGDVVVLSAAFTVGGAGTDPTSVVCRVKQPDGVVETPTVVPGTPNDGLYTAAFTPDQEGHHYYRWEGTGAAQSAGEGEFVVRVSRVL